MCRSSAPFLHRTFVLLSIVVLLLSALSGNAAEPAPLRWKFRNGEKLRWTLNQHIGLQGPNMGVAEEAELRAGMEFEISVLETSDEGARLRITTTAVTSSMKSSEIDFEYDSRTFDPDAVPTNDDEELLLETLRVIAATSQPLLDYDIECRVDARGVVTEVKVDPELAAAFTGPMESSKPLLEPAGLNSVFFGALVPMPESLTADTTWNETIVCPRRFGANSFLMHFELAYVGEEDYQDRRQAKFTIAPRMEFKNEKKSPLAGFLTIDVKPRSSTGVLYFDGASGRVTHCEWESNNVLGFAIKDQEPFEGEFNLRTTSDLEALK